MEERILEALEYITISLDDIRDYQDFLKYKPEYNITRKYDEWTIAEILAF